MAFWAGMGTLGEQLGLGRQIQNQQAQQQAQLKLQEQGQELQRLNQQIALQTLQQKTAEWQQQQDPRGYLTKLLGRPPSTQEVEGYLGIRQPSVDEQILGLAQQQYPSDPVKQLQLYQQTLHQPTADDQILQWAQKLYPDDPQKAAQFYQQMAHPLQPRQPSQLDLIAQSLGTDAQGNPTPEAKAATAILNKQTELTGEKRQPLTEDIQITPGGPFMKLREAPAGTPVGTPGTYTPKGTKEVWTIEGPTRAAPRPPAAAQQIPPADIHFLNVANKIYGQNFPYTKTGAAAAKDYVKNQMISPSKQDLDNTKSSLATANKDIGTYVTAMGKEGFLQSLQGYVAPHSYGLIKPPQAIQDDHDKAVASATEAAIAALNSGQQVPMEIQQYVDTSKLAAANKRFMQIMQGRQIQQEGGIPPEDTGTTDTDTDTDSNAQ